MTLTQNSETVIFGGSFNPPTMAHIEVINACLDLPSCRDLWVVPSGPRADKDIETSNSDRLAMLELALSRIACPDLAVINDIELRDTVTQTWRTIGRLASRYPERKFRFAFGVDSYLSMPLWQGGIDMQRDLPMAIVSRDGTSVPYAANIVPIYIDVPSGVSSSEVRRRASLGHDLSGLVCPEIEQYIEQKILYRRGTI